MNVPQHKIGLKKRLLYIGISALITLFSFPSLTRAEDLAPSDTGPVAETTEQPNPSAVEPQPAATPSQELAAPPPPETPPPVVQGPQSPAGADHGTYTYNEATGLWENDKYTWDPVTKQTS